MSVDEKVGDVMSGDDMDEDGAEEVLADESANEIEESQSGSMLGDDFGQLHKDYTVRGRCR